VTLFTIAVILVAGIVFLAVEFFLVPGFSLPGILGIVTLTYGIYLSYAEYGAAASLLTVLGCFTAALVLFRAALQSKTLRRFSLTHTQRGGIAAEDYSGLLRKTGVALTDLRPSGTAEIDRHRYSVVTDGTYIEEHTDIVVTAVEGSRILVSPYQRG
jgi:membrane-bound serine protease (ClpP class)